MKTGIINEPTTPMAEPPGELPVVPRVEKDEFFPTGAIAFFISLVALCLVIWFGIYFIMLNRI